METTVTEEMIAAIALKVVQRLCALQPLEIPIGVSNRHIHLSREDVDALFGKGYQLTPVKMLKQPGQYACAETLTVKGPKGSLNKVRILGPERKKTQLEVSVTDSYQLGFRPPVRMSGDLEGSVAFDLVGPEGSVHEDEGAIVALRHIHMTPQIAQRYGYADGQRVDVEAGNDQRRVVFRNVPIRVTETSALEMHLDTDEANAAGAVNDATARIIEPGE